MVRADLEVRAPHDKSATEWCAPSKDGASTSSSCSSPFMFLSPLGERLGEGVNAKTASCITPSPSLSPKGERSMRREEHERGEYEGQRNTSS